MSYSRRWLEERGSEDSHGRALWALGTVVGRSADPGRQSLAGQLFHAALPAVVDVHEPARLGVRAARHRRVPARVRGRQRRRRRRARRSPSGCFDLFQRDERARLAVVRGPRSPTATRACRRRSSSPARGWSDEAMTRRRAALARMAASIQQRPTTATSRRSARTASIARRPSARAFDQQPVEACAMVSACLEAHRVTGDARWAERARRAFNWFLGAEPAAAAALRRVDRRLPRRAARRSRQREPGRGVDAVVPARAASRCARPIAPTRDPRRAAKRDHEP